MGFEAPCRKHEDFPGLQPADDNISLVHLNDDTIVENLKAEICQNCGVIQMYLAASPSGLSSAPPRSMFYPASPDLCTTPQGLTVWLFSYNIWIYAWKHT